MKCTPLNDLVRWSETRAHDRPPRGRRRAQPWPRRARLAASVTERHFHLKRWTAGTLDCLDLDSWQLFSQKWMRYACHSKKDKWQFVIDDQSKLSSTNQNPSTLVVATINWRRASTDCSVAAGGDNNEFDVFKYYMIKCVTAWWKYASFGEPLFFKWPRYDVTKPIKCQTVQGILA